MKLELQKGQNMTRDELRAKVEELVEAEPGSLEESTALDTVENWDSVSMVTFIALADEHFQKQLPAREIGRCETVGDLLDLATRRAASQA